MEVKKTADRKRDEERVKPRTAEPRAKKSFRHMSIKELRLHETGILNLYKDGGALAHTHNKEVESEDMFDVRLTKEEYESIFEGPPTFHEKRAFMENFRKKWREDHGHCSLFDRR